MSVSQRQNSLSHQINDMETSHNSEPERQATEHENLNNLQNNSEDMEELSHEEELLRYESKRLLSFPDNCLITHNIILQLIKFGFYYCKNTQKILCAFCIHITPMSLEDVIRRDDLQTLTHDCDMTRNVAMQEIHLNYYNYEFARIFTFLKGNWPKEARSGNFPVGALSLARSGFFYTGTDDAVRCYFCRLEVRGWEEGDIAQSEHSRWNPNCPFLQGFSINNVELGQEDISVAVPDVVSTSVPFQASEAASGPFDNTDKLAISLENSKHPEYKTLSSRKETYYAWPEVMSQRPEALSKAGFYYTGRGDRVICYHCNGGLKDWGVGDDPWEEHAAWFPNCEYLKLLQPEDFIKRSSELKKHREQQVVESAETDSRTSTETQPNTTSSIDVTRLCKVCLDVELGIVFLPCGHMCTCPQCAPQLDACPVCRKKPTAYVRAILPN